jgi:hypothetical protein
MSLINPAIEKAGLIVTIRRGIYRSESNNSPLALCTLNLLRILQQQVLNMGL